MSKIEWTEKLWSPVLGCTPCSVGCLNCWAKTWADRFNKGDFSLRLQPDNLDKPLHWKKPRKIFVCGMSDLFHPLVPFEFQCKVFETIATAGQHTYQILTKRAKEMKEFFQECEDWDSSEWPHVWLGVSISTQKEADEKIPILLQIPAAIRFVSIEPMLEGISLAKWMFPEIEETTGMYGELLDWIIIGGESKGRSVGRPCKIEWVQSIVDQCKSVNIPVFVKQIHKGGKLIKMPKGWPQQYPEAKEKE